MSKVYLQFNNTVAPCTVFHLSLPTSEHKEEGAQGGCWLCLPTLFWFLQTQARRSATSQSREARSKAAGNQRQSKPAQHNRRYSAVQRHSIKLLIYVESPEWFTLNSSSLVLQVRATWGGGAVCKPGLSGVRTPRSEFIPLPVHSPV